MKKFTLFLFFTGLLFSSAVHAQQFITLHAGKNTQINGFTASYVAVLRKSKKGEDYYRVTVSLINNENDYLHLFGRATETFIKSDQEPLAVFQFANATGRGLSATKAKMYPHPLTISVPYKCKKCPPPSNPKEDPYNHYVKKYYIGVQLQHGSIIMGRYDIRVPAGMKPIVRVSILYQ